MFWKYCDYYFAFMKTQLHAKFFRRIFFRSCINNVTYKNLILRLFKNNYKSLNLTYEKNAPRFYKYTDSSLSLILIKQTATNFEIPTNKILIIIARKKESNTCYLFSLIYVLNIKLLKYMRTIVTIQIT